jgi:hypothetical protein
MHETLIEEVMTSDSQHGYSLTTSSDCAAYLRTYGICLAGTARKLVPEECDITVVEASDLRRCAATG